MTNPLASTKEWKDGVKLYKKNLLKYQPGPSWYFGLIESGINWDDTLMTMEDLQKRILSVSPIGPKVSIDEVKDVTPSYEFLCKNFPDGKSYSYDKFIDWVMSQKDVFFYSRGKENFYGWEAFSIASKMGYRKVIMENLS